MKMCTKCKEIKELELFDKRNASADGKQSRCKKCRSEINATEKAKKQRREYQRTDGFKQARNRYLKNRKANMTYKKPFPTGVYIKPDGRYGAKIYYNSKTHHLGIYDTVLEASNAYQQARKSNPKKMSWSNDTKKRRNKKRSIQEWTKDPNCPILIANQWQVLKIKYAPEDRVR